MKDRILIYGAYGHTGEFVTSYLYDQGLRPILCGRNKEKLKALELKYPAAPTRFADTSDPESLIRAGSMADLVINCAGPYLDTAEPWVKTAIRLGKQYVDLSAEQKSVLELIEGHTREAQESGIVILPSAAFYGGLADLMATKLLLDWGGADEIQVYTGLDSWHPTHGTRLTGQRNHHPRLVYENGELVPFQSGDFREWSFSDPIGTQTVTGLPLTEVVTLSRHLKVNSVYSFLSINALDDLKGQTMLESGTSEGKMKSQQHFCVDVVAIKGSEKRKIRAWGQDIYAVSAPLAIEAAKRILAGEARKTGVITLGEAFDPGVFLLSLRAYGLELSPITEILPSLQNSKSPHNSGGKPA